MLVLIADVSTATNYKQIRKKYELKGKTAFQ